MKFIEQIDDNTTNHDRVVQPKSFLLYLNNISKKYFFDWWSKMVYFDIEVYRDTNIDKNEHIRTPIILSIDKQIEYPTLNEIKHLQVSVKRWMNYAI